MINAPTLNNSFSSFGEIDPAVHYSDMLLKISANKNSLRYFVQSKAFGQVIFYGSYILHHISTSTELVSQLEKIFDKDEILQLPFGKVVYGSNTDYSVVPSIMKSDGSGQFHYDETNSLSLAIQHVSEPEVEELLRLRFNNIEFRHLNSAFLNAIPDSENGIENKLFINVASEFMDVIKFKSNSVLQLMNRYEFKAVQDFIYFELLVSNELKLDRDTIELVLIGEVSADSKIYDMCFRYFRNISFINHPDNIRFSKTFSDFPKHLHYNLYNLKE